MTAETTDRVDADRAPAGEPAGEPALFTPDTLFWELTGQYLYAATTGSAFVPQVMHPAIGAVVDRWSTYRADPWGRAARSFASVQTWIYGGQTALDEGHRLRRMHKDLGAVDERGRSHHALSAEPWAWVPLTAFHATVTSFRYFMPSPLSAEQEEQAYQETLRMCRILRVPERMLPPTTAAYWAYFDDMIENTLENHPTAHNVLATAASAPPLPGLPAPLRRLWAPVRGAGARLNHLITVGTLPPAARDKLGLSWSRAEELELRALGKLVGRLNAPLPERIKYMPIAYHARRAARAQQQLTNALAGRPI